MRDGTARHSRQIDLICSKDASNWRALGTDQSMNEMTGPADEAADLAQQVAEALRGRTVATAESMTSGNVAAALAAAQDASQWLQGSVVAYSRQVKFSVLGVDRGPVITAGCARQMARGVTRLLGADISVATTGAGGPDSEEGQPAGTVFIAVATQDRCEVKRYQFDGGPPRVVHLSTIQALRDLVALVTAGGGSTAADANATPHSSASR
jgi:nicotinamide-nucleotide amidase